jgi:hypothetical protein
VKDKFRKCLMIYEMEGKKAINVWKRRQRSSSFHLQGKFNRVTDWYLYGLLIIYFSSSYKNYSFQLYRVGDIWGSHGNGDFSSFFWFVTPLDL